MLQVAVLQATLPTLISPSPPLTTILKRHHIPTRPGQSDHFPFALHNIEGGVRLCMPTVVSHLRSNAYKPKDNNTPGEGEVFNTHTNEWEEPDAKEKELLLGYTLGDTAAAGVSDEDRAVRLGRALGGGGGGDCTRSPSERQAADKVQPR